MYWYSDVVVVVLCYCCCCGRRLLYNINASFGFRIYSFQFNNIATKKKYVHKRIQKFKTLWAINQTIFLAKEIFFGVNAEEKIQAIILAT